MSLIQDSVSKANRVLFPADTTLAAPSVDIYEQSKPVHNLSLGPDAQPDTTVT